MIPRWLRAINGLAWLIVCCMPGLAGGQEREFSLDDLVDIALRHNPVLMASQQQVAATRARVTQTTSAYWPQITGGASYDRNRLGNIGRSIGAGSIKKEFDNYEVGVSASQYLFDFGQTQGLVAQSRANYSASYEGFASVLADVVQQAKVGYFEVLKNQRLVQVAEETLNAQEKHLEQARAFYDVGLRPKIDVTRAEVDVARDRQNLITVRYRLQNSRVDLERILGGPPTPGPYRLAEVTERPERPPRLEPLIDEALAVRPEVLRFQAQVKAAEGQLRAAVGRNWPSIDGIGGYNYSNTEFPLENNWQVGVQMSWPIFTGFRTQGEVNEAKSLVKQAQAELERERLQVTQQVSQAYLRLGEAEESIATARVALRQAQENLDLADGRYRSGVGDAIEFSDAQVSLTRAKSDLVSASYEYLQAQAELERALGRGPRPEQLPDARETASAGQSGDVSAVTRSP